LLIATITLLSFMPARCWMAPLMPQAMYSCGATILPVWPDLPVVGRVAGVHRGAAGAQRGAELVGQRRQHFVELLAAAQRAAAADDDLGGGQLGAVALGDLAADEALALAAVGHRATVSTAALPPVAAPGRSRWCAR
jgi:hypothetical protein